MIARGGEGLGQIGEDAAAVVFDFAGFAVHQFLSANDATTEGGANGLMAEADAENGNFSGETPDERDADAGFLGRAGAGRYKDTFGAQGGDFVERDLVVAAHFELLAHLAEILGEVVGEGIVVVEEQDHDFFPGWWAISRAETMARALLTVSCYSRSGTESATTPPPAWM